jgi:hypothetical protein
LRQRELVFPGYRLFDFDPRAVADLLDGEVDRQRLLAAIARQHGGGRDQHPPPREPAAGIDHEITNYPMFVVEKQILHVPDLSVSGTKFEVFQCFRVSEHGSTVCRAVFSA